MSELVGRKYTIWLWLTICHGKSQFLMGKPSISMGHLCHGYVSHNQTPVGAVESQRTTFSLKWVSSRPFHRYWKTSHLRPKHALNDLHHVRLLMLVANSSEEGIRINGPICCFFVQNQREICSCSRPGDFRTFWLAWEASPFGSTG